jgi:hypothetical protein
MVSLKEGSASLARTTRFGSPAAVRCRPIQSPPRIDFLGIGDLLAIEHAAARLIDQTLAKAAIQSVAKLQHNDAIRQLHVKITTVNEGRLS